MQSNDITSHLHIVVLKHKKEIKSLIKPYVSPAHIVICFGKIDIKMLLNNDFALRAECWIGWNGFPNPSRKFLHLMLSLI